MTGRDPEIAVARAGSLKRRLCWLAGGLAAVAVSIALATGSGPEAASADPPSTRGAAAKKPAPGRGPAESDAGMPDKPDVVAVVNGEPVSRNDLARECLRHYGEEVLESLVNRHLIAHHCRERNITVTQEDVQQEIERMAQRFGLPTDQWLKMLKDERGISAVEYANDLIWPMVALRKLADARLQVSPEELQDAYETYYGPAVQTRLIACKDMQSARRVHALALENPDDFGNLAKQYSVDTSASARGLIQPIRKHMGDPHIEQAAFRMQEGEVSEILRVGSQYIILKCESHLAPRKIPLEQVQKVLEEGIRDKKLRREADGLFAELQASAQVENIWNDAQKRREHPGVAALINGRKMTVRELAEECLERHGIEVLEGMIHRRLLEQACKRREIEVTAEDMETEIARAAAAMGKTDANDNPDVAAWLQEVADEQEMPIESYRRDVVWPTAALKKLVDGAVEVTDEDLKKGYEANYGPRVRCRAIVLNQQRKAQEVWEMARDKPTSEYFGKLAEQHSVDASAGTQGEVPPIQRHGGQPLLEQEAFTLAPGDLSGVIQVGDKFVVLFCEGYTQPPKVTFDEVRDYLYEDLREKKLRLAMAHQFSRLEDAARIDNHLTGVSHSPRKAQKRRGAAPPSRPLDDPRLAPATAAGSSRPRAAARPAPAGNQ